MKNKIGKSKADLVAETLEREIKSGHISKGDQLASENTLMQRFSVSRNTVRKGLEQLSRLGLITTRSGIGSFVTYGGEVIDSSLGWTLALSQSGAEIKTHILQVSKQECPKTDKVLKRQHTQFLCIDRIRVPAGTNQAISLERSRLPWRPEFEGVLENGLPEGSVNTVLQQANLVTDHGEEWAGVLPSLSDEDADLMQREAGEPMMLLRRVTRLASGDVIECVESILDPLHFGLHMEF
jgi:GntR family transcriptional regulator